ncbi:hypothetical protein NUW58_g8054 [Xylaria curta]|uniref:Uncharacterized protein n=1 Tax=Xylaria curta TaxID=42375 RepID=A0ACC1NDI3_9PEZI|nr:hypothetical protein NUW58_g8054 [Xylaria curta]
MQRYKTVAGYFTSNQRFTFVGHAGLGRHGGTLILSEAASSEQDARKIIIKYSYGQLALDKQSDADEQLRNEYQWLKRLRGAEHIVQLIDMADCSLHLPGISDGEATYEESLQKQMGKMAATGYGSQTSAIAPVRRCPTFALEYLEYGTLHGLKKRLYTNVQPWIPDRVLWSIWLCMVRQCVAMAFPPDIPDDQYFGQIIREVMQDRPYTQLAQNSAHTNNFMFGTPTLQGNEHEPNLPVVKVRYPARKSLIYRLLLWQKEDVKESYLILVIAHRLRPGEIRGWENGAAAFMRLCCLQGFRDESYRPLNAPIPYTWTDGSGTHTIPTLAPRILWEEDLMDAQLRHLLVRIMAYPYELKPSLSDVLKETEMAMTKDLGESDDFVLSFMQHWLYNPDESW